MAAMLFNGLDYRIGVRLDTQGMPIFRDHLQWFLELVVNKLPIQDQIIGKLIHFKYTLHCHLSMATLIFLGCKIL